MARPRIHAGEWFAVPLKNGTWAGGLVASSSKNGVLAGYFFGPARTELPDLHDFIGAQPGEAILVARFTHLGLRNGSWPILGTLRDWNPEEWSPPGFIRHEELSGRTFRVHYDETDPAIPLRQEQVRLGDVQGEPEDGSMGHIFVQQRLSRLLGAL